MLSKGAAVTSWPRGTGFSEQKEYTSTISALAKVILAKIYPAFAVCVEHSPPLNKSCIEVLSNLGCFYCGLYLLYNGHEGMTSLVRRAQCPIGIAVVDESRRLRTLGQSRVALLFASL